MKLFVRLHKDLPASSKTLGMPDDWPAEVEEADDRAADPKDGRLVMASVEELEAHKAKLREAYSVWRQGVELPAVKADRFVAVDVKTEKLIADGFVFAEKTFSLSLAAQATYTSLYLIRSESVLKYPMKVNTADDSDYHLLRDADEVQAFYFAAMAALFSHLEAGTRLKDEVRAAENAEVLQAVVDAR